MFKFLPVSLYNVPAVETWLSDQARRGWYAVGFSGSGRMRFQKGEPEETAYRLEPQFRRDAPPDAEMLELYAAKGWTFVDRVGGFCLWRAARRSAGEIHTDPVAEELAYGWMAERQEEQLRFTCAEGFVYGSLILLFCCITETPLLFIFGAGYSFGILLLLSGLVKIIRDFIEFLTIRKLRRQLLSGEPVNHTASPYRLRRLVRRCLSATVAAAFLCMLFLALEKDTYGELRDAPVPPVAQLGVDTPMHTPYGQYMEGLLITEWSVYQYSHDQFGKEIAGWQARVYRLRLPIFAGLILREVVSGNISYRMEPPAPLENTPFDEARYLRAPDGDQYLIARLGGRVLYYKANVPEDLRNHLEKFAAALSAA